jgi:hypothetical protein
MLSIAMAMGFGGVTDSMRNSIGEWMETALNPDFFISASSDLVSRSFTFPGEIGPLIEAVPGVKSVQLVRNARVTFRDTPVMVVSIDEKLKTTVCHKPVLHLDEMYRLTGEGRA